MYKVIFTTNEDICEKYNKESKADAKSLCGMCCHKTQKIYIDRNMSYDVILDTLIHERIHEFIYTNRLTVNSEESMCFILEKYIDDLYKIKQECVKFVSEEIDE